MRRCADEVSLEVIGVRGILHWYFGHPIRRQVEGFELRRTPIVQRRVPAQAVVKDLHILKQARPGFIARMVILKADELGLQGMESFGVKSLIDGSPLPS